MSNEINQNIKVVGLSFVYLFKHLNPSTYTTRKSLVYLAKDAHIYNFYPKIKVGQSCYLVLRGASALKEQIKIDL
jgi:hypothetical protein